MDDLEARLRSWADADLVSTTQIEAILDHERARAAPAGDRRDLSRLAEVIGYLGGVLVFVGVFVALVEFWDRLELWAQLLLVGVAAGILLVTGWWAHRSVVAALRRLAGVLWLVSTAVFALFVGVIVGEVTGLRDETAFLAVTLPTALYAAVLWYLRRASLQEIAAFVALVAALVSALLHVPRIEPEAIALAVWSLSITWGLLVWVGLLRPAVVGYALASVTALASAQVVALDDLATSGQVLGLVTAVTMAAGSIPAGSLVVLAIGAVGTFVFIAQIVFTHFAATIGVPLALFVVGMALIGAAFLIVRLRPIVSAPRRMVS